MHRQITGRLTGRVTKWVVAAAWIIVFVVASGFAAKLTDVQNNEASSWLPASAESTKVLDELSTAVDPNDIPTLVVYDRSSGLTEDDLAAMDEQAAEIAKIDGVTSAGVISPNVAQQQGLPVQLLSEDGEVGYLYFVFNFGENGWTDIPAAADEVRDIAQVDGVNVHLAGYGGQAADSAEAFEGIDTNLILITLLVVIVILLLTYRSPILWLLPIISAVFAYMTSAGVVYLLAKYADLTVNGQSQAILGILVIGAGTDYALLLVARYREELRRHEHRLLGPGRQPHCSQPPQGVADHGRPPGDRLPGSVPARPLRALDRGHLHQGVRLDQGSAGAHRARPGRQLEHRPGGRQHRCPARGAGRARGDRRSRRAPADPGPGLRALLLRGHHQRRHLVPGRVRHRGVLP